MPITKHAHTVQYYVLPRTCRSRSLLYNFTMWRRTHLLRCSAIQHRLHHLRQRQQTLLCSCFSTYGIETVMLHGGQSPDPATGSRAVPLYQTTSFQFHNTQHAAELFALEEAGHIYSRISNPTTDVLEKRIALLEGGVGALATSSGQAAITTTMLTLMGQGSHIVSGSTLYGGTHHLFSDTLPKLGITTTFVADPNDLDGIREAIQPNTKAVYAETIGNPTLNVLDIEALANVAHEANVPLVIDSTFSTPYLCTPLQHGADIVVHSATKYIGGHGTSIGGIIVDGGKFDWKANGDKFPAFTTPDASYNGLTYAGDFGTLAFITKARVQTMRDIGACISPFNAWCLLQGLETLHLRMPRHCDNAKQVAAFLQSHPNVAWVSYPSAHDGALVNKYIRNGYGGGMVVFGIRGTREDGMRVIERCSLLSHLANVGDARSLILHPASTTHQQLSATDLKDAGIGQDMIRLSVGIESIDDIVADLDQALRFDDEGHVMRVVNDDGVIRSICSSPILTPRSSSRRIRIGVVGLSSDPSRPSYRTSRKMQRLGYEIVPINPASEEILGQKCYASLDALVQDHVQLDVLQVFRAAQHVVPIVKEAVAVQDRIGLSCIWLQEGIISEEAQAYVAQHPIDFVMNRCTYKECQRLMGPMGTFM